MKVLYGAETWMLRSYVNEMTEAVRHMDEWRIKKTDPHVLTVAERTESF